MGNRYPHIYDGPNLKYIKNGDRVVIRATGNDRYLIANEGGGLARVPFATVDMSIVDLIHSSDDGGYYFHRWGDEATSQIFPTPGAAYRARKANAIVWESW